LLHVQNVDDVFQKCAGYYSFTGFQRFYLHMCMITVILYNILHFTSNCVLNMNCHNKIEWLGRDSDGLKPEWPTHLLLILT